MHRTLFLAFTALQFGCSETVMSGSKASNDAPSDPLVDTGVWGDDPPERDDPEADEEEGSSEETPPDDLPDDPPDDPSEDPPDDPPYEEPPVDDCIGTSDLVYVIDRGDEAIYTFNPATLSFDLVGELDCGIWAGSPGSMAITREGVAYVRYSDNTVYSVDLETMNCEETSYDGDEYGAFGMGFATNSDSTWRDKLYVANHSQLAVIDTETWSRTVFGTLSSQSELTGNAAGELWAILPLETPAQVVRLNKATGSVEDAITITGTPSPSDIDTFAFATWSGDFFIFIRTYGMGQSTDVYRLSADGNTTLVAEGTGMDVVGAGVSTCAPTY